MLALMGGPSERSIKMQDDMRAFARHLLHGAPAQRIEKRTAARPIDLRDAAPSARCRAFVLTEHVPTDMWLMKIDLRCSDRHRDTPITSLIRLASCTRCSPHGRSQK